MTEQDRRSFYDAKKKGKGWGVDLVTPVEGGRDLRTTLETTPSKVHAVARARQLNTEAEA